jgi:hypothetical protein
MTKDEALDLALEALEESIDLVREDYENAKKLYSNYRSRQARLLGQEDGLSKHEAAITAVKQARALDKKAENARELGLDYEPVQDKVTLIQTNVGIGERAMEAYEAAKERTRQSARSAWVGLTDEEIRACIASNKYAFEIVRAAEAKLKEKNT